jgi:hypothetical protein
MRGKCGRVLNKKRATTISGVLREKIAYYAKGETYKII